MSEQIALVRVFYYTYQGLNDLVIRVDDFSPEALNRAIDTWMRGKFHAAVPLGWHGWKTAADKYHMYIGSA